MKEIMGDKPGSLVGESHALDSSVKGKHGRAIHMAKIHLGLRIIQNFA